MTGYYSNVTVRVLVVDPQPFFCEALRAAFTGSNDIEVIGSATDELDAERIALEQSPDVVLTEADLDGGSGLSLSRRLGERSATLILTRRHEGEVLLDAVSAGAKGCLGHDLDIGDLARHVMRAAEGRFVLDEDRLYGTLRRASALRIANQEGSPKLTALTPREREVLALLAGGLDNQAISERLHVSTHTARTHVGNILRKLGVHSRAEAARLALQEGEGPPSTHVLRIRGPELEAR
jgi:DNA-binding NarL/FixJ family response regulator